MNRLRLDTRITYKSLFVLGAAALLSLCVLMFYPLLHDVIAAPLSSTISVGNRNVDIPALWSLEPPDPYLLGIRKWGPTIFSREDSHAEIYRFYGNASAVDTWKRSVGLGGAKSVHPLATHSDISLPGWSCSVARKGQYQSLECLSDNNKYMLEFNGHARDRAQAIETIERTVQPFDRY